MKKDFRIRKRKDFINVSRYGFCFRTSSLVAQCVSNGLGWYRVGFTASKKVGAAVLRNRCKRRMRAAADVVLKEYGLAGVDYVLIARKSASDIVWNELLRETTSAVRFLNGKIENQSLSK